MNKDRSWMNHRGIRDRRKAEYVTGVDEFLNYAFSGKEVGDKVMCPCLKCYFRKWLVRSTIRYHLLSYGIVKDYNPWVHHGESQHNDNSTSGEGHEGGSSDSDDTTPLDCDPINRWSSILEIGHVYGQEDGLESRKDSCEVPRELVELAKDAEAELHPKTCSDMMATPATSGQHHSDVLQEDSQSTLTYRQKRRLNKSKRKGRKRGPTTGKKYLAEKERNPEAKPEINFSEELRRVVGQDADRFICECSLWVKEFCPLDSVNWSRMNATAKQRLYDKIKDNYTLPETLCGQPIDKALSFQCAGLFRGWRFRLKEEYFDPKSREQSRENIPTGVERDVWNWLVDFWSTEKQQHISGNNRKLRLMQTIKPANGARSTARILDDMLNAMITTENEDEPVYVRLYERTKRHKDGTWDPDAEANYNALKKLHSDEMEKHGKDNLTVEDAYIDVLKTQPGYIRGLGPGSRPPKKSKTEESTQIREHFTAQIQELQQTAVEREAKLNGVIADLKSSNDELRKKMEWMQQEALERENRLREEFLQLVRSHR